MTKQRSDALTASRHTVWSLLAVSLAGVIVTALFFWTTRSAELNGFKSQFEHDASIRANLIAVKLDQCMLVTRALQGYYNASDMVERREFAIFTAPFLAEWKELQALAWLPHVLQSQRADFEKGVRQEGLPGFQIKDLTPDRRFISADKREEYYPIEYVEPLKGNAIKFGFNMASEPIRWAAMEKARDTGKAAITERIQMMQADNAFGFIIYLPVYRKAVPATTVQERRTALEGFVAGIFRTDDALAAAMNIVMPEGISYDLLDLSAPPDRQLICHWLARLKGERSWRSPLSPSLPGYVRKIDFGDRQWEMNFTANSAYVEKHYSLTYWLILPIGFGLTFLLGLYLWAIQSQRTRMERTVLERTAELRKYQENLEGMVEERSAEIIRTNETLKKEVAERKQVETELRKLSVAVEQNPATIVITDREGNIEYVNPKFCQITGYTLDEARGKNPRILKSDKTTPEEYQILWETILSGREWRGEFYNKKKNGEYYWELAVIAPIKNENGSITNFIAIKEDITDRKRAEEQALIFRRFAETSGQGLSMATLQGQILYMNSTLCRILDEDNLEDVYKKGFPEYYPPEFREQLLNEVLPKVMSVGQWVGELALVSTKGKHTPTIENFFLIRDEEGRPLRLADVVTDITERKRMEDDLRKAKDAAEAVNTIKGNFLASVSHEIRTPLNAIIGMTGLLLDSKLDAEQQDCAETVRTSGEMLLALINNILDFSKIEANKIDLENQPFDLRQCIEESLDLVNQRADEKKLEIGYHMQVDLPSFFVGDVSRLRQILVNLLGNAVKFTDKGEVMASASGKAQGDGQYELHFVIQDTGIGIPLDHRDRLFQSFSQVDSSTTRRFGGTGLGLAISKRLCELMGGKMWMESSGVPGEGSEFHFTILAGLAADQLPRETTNVANLAGKRVLIVDDNKSNRDILVAQVEHLAMLPTAVASGPEALDLLHQGATFDLAFLDLQMPEMDGLMLAEEMKKIPAAAAMPLVLLSSRSCRLSESENARFSTRLLKPIKPAQLYNVLCMILGKDKDVVSMKKPDIAPMPSDRSFEQRYPLRIILAEDNLINQKVALKMLAKLGYRCDVASNGLEVLEAVKLIPYDVILMDCQMPEMDGYEATRQIRLREQPGRQKTVYIIAMTAHAMKGDREECLAAGMNDYLSKPVREAELKAALQRCRLDGLLGDPAAEVSMPQPNQEQLSVTEYVAVDEVAPPTLTPDTPALQPYESDKGDSPIFVDTKIGTVPDEPLLDVELLKEMSETGPDGLGELVDLYLTQAKEIMADLRTAIAAGAAEDVKQLAHKLAGSSAVCGVKTIVPPLRALEQQGKEGRLSEADQLLVQAGLRLELSEKALADYLQDLRDH